MTGVAVWANGADANAIYEAVCGKEQEPRYFPHPDERWEFHKADVPGDNSSVGSTATKGDSSAGLRVLTRSGKPGVLVARHSGIKPGSDGDGNSHAYLYSPGEGYGGAGKLDQVGTIEFRPLKLDGGFNAVECACVTYFDKVAKKIDLYAPVLVRPLLWAGWVPAGAYAPADVTKFPVAAPSKEITTGWVRDQLRKHLPGIPELTTYLPQPPRLDLVKLFPWSGDKSVERRRMTIEARVWNEKLLIWVRGVLGEVVDAVDVDESYLGRDAFVAGARSRLTACQIYATKARVEALPCNGGPTKTANFDGWFLIKGLHREAPCTLPGDSNTTIYVPDKNDPFRLSACGMVVAGANVREEFDGKINASELVTPAQPITACLREYGARIWLPKPR